MFHCAIAAAASIWLRATTYTSGGAPAADVLQSLLIFSTAEVDSGRRLGLAPSHTFDWLALFSYHNLRLLHAMVGEP